MKNGVDFILSQDALQESLIADIAAHNLDLLEIACPDKFTLRDPISNQANNVCFRLKKSFDQPRAKQPGASGDKSWTIAPKGHCYPRTIKRSPRRRNTGPARRAACHTTGPRGLPRPRT